MTRPVVVPRIKWKRGWRCVSRYEAVTVPCPKCGSPAGLACTGARKPPQPRVAPHISRFHEFMRELGR